MYHAYYAVGAGLGRAGWALGMLLGLVHALFVSTALVSVLLPSVPTANSSPCLVAPGFMMLNYGPATPAVSIPVHVAYGAVVGLFIGAQSRDLFTPAFPQSSRNVRRPMSVSGCS